MSQPLQRSSATGGQSSKRSIESEEVTAPRKKRRMDQGDCEVSSHPTPAATAWREHQSISERPALNQHQGVLEAACPTDKLAEEPLESMFQQLSLGNVTGVHALWEKASSDAKPLANMSGKLFKAVEGLVGDLEPLLIGATAEVRDREIKRAIKETLEDLDEPDHLGIKPLTMLYEVLAWLLNPDKMLQTTRERDILHGENFAKVLTSLEHLQLVRSSNSDGNLPATMSTTVLEPECITDWMHFDDD